MEIWKIRAKKADFEGISNKYNISPMLARLLTNRNVSEGDIERYLTCDRTKQYDPFLMKDMSVAVDIVLQAMKSRSRIRIIGDYDVDGICSSYILKSSLEHFGADVDVRHPDRFIDGYGMNESMVDTASEDGVDLIITCDNGISAVQAVRHAKELGIKVIVTDHHEPPETLPEADALIDPKQKDCDYPFDELCGGAVAYKFICAVMSSLENISAQEKEAWTNYMLQFVSIATVADVVPLKDENRLLTKLGLEQLHKTENKGILALCREKKIEPENIDSYHLGFVIGPCLNSAGRLKNARLGFDLLEAGDLVTAQKIASELNLLNKTRQDLTSEMEEEAIRMVEIQLAESGSLPDIVVCYIPGAKESVAGIVAGRLKEAYNHPVYVFTDSAEGIKGSGRSIEGYNMIQGLADNSDILKKYGGHKLAAGLTLDCSPEEFAAAINENTGLESSDFDKTVWIDMQLPFMYATENFVNEIRMLEPFGSDNDKPLFAERNISFSNVRVMGARSNALRMNLKTDDGYGITGIMFGSEKYIASVKDELDREVESQGADARIMITYYPQVNEFRGNKSMNAVVRNIKVSGK